MRFVIQRVTHAEVEVEQTIIGKIKKGFLVFIGISQEDTNFAIYLVCRLQKRKQTFLYKSWQSNPCRGII